MSKTRYLTKSRFKLGIECPTKLFYTGKKEYPDMSIDDPFLMALADGGYQIVELAKRYFAGGHDIHSLDYDEALEQTNKLLKKKSVIIFEPAIKYKNLFVRIDILVKSGKHLDLIEVKSKSLDCTSEDPFLTKRDKVLDSSWSPYLYDVAFQKYVLEHAFPEYSINAYLMLVDKNKKCHVNGLNQKFRIIRDTNNRKGIQVSSSLTKTDLKVKLLTKIPVDDCIAMIFNGTDSKEPAVRSFEDTIMLLADHYKKDKKISPEIGSHCRNCSFQCDEQEEKMGLLNGFKECWKEVLHWKNNDFNDATVLDIWNFRKKDYFIERGKIKLKDLKEEDIGIINNNGSGLTTTERQWIQIEKYQKEESDPYIDVKGLKEEMETWNYPLHFIDFETTMVPIPFTKGSKPYEGIAFQFSHHTVDENGNVRHEGEYLNSKKGKFPNYDFIRALKKELEQDNGTIFRYAAHENTFLNHIHEQLRSDLHPPKDRTKLMKFIKSITKSKNGSDETWVGERNMVDMCELVKKYYYDPYTNGSNSIKYVLPAILNTSDFLQKKYSSPIYGAENGIRSRNFINWKWIEIKDGIVTDPYKLLPKMFQDASDKNFEILSEETEIANGGAAMTAYTKMQFSEMSEYEENELRAALLKYCELDTMAMVMIYEGWREMVYCESKKILQKCY